MKNRILATTLAILLCLSLAACSGAPAEESPAPDETAAPSPTPAPSAEPEETQAPPPEGLLSLLHRACRLPEICVKSVETLDRRRENLYNAT